MEDALQSLSSSTFGKGGKGKTRSAQRLITEAIDSVDVFEKISKASQASKELGCDEPQDQVKGTCELLSLALSALAFEISAPNDGPSLSKGSKSLSNNMSNNSSGKGSKESSKVDSRSMSSMMEVWEDSTSDWSLDYKQKAFISTSQMHPVKSPSESNSKGDKGAGKASKGSGKAKSKKSRKRKSDEKSGKGKSSKMYSRKLYSRNMMASKSEVMAYLSHLSSDEKKALVLILIIGILEHLTGDANEMD